jgi:Xaa-Pro aminopeptidase
MDHLFFHLATFHFSIARREGHMGIMRMRGWNQEMMNAHVFRMPVEEGMVLALEPKFSFPGVGITGIEDDYPVTAQGLQRLTLTEQNVLRVSGGPAPA